MPNRRPRKRAPKELERSLERLVIGELRVESRMGAEWNVQPMSAANSVKPYLCPGCDREIAIRTRHVVVWRADSIFAERAVEDRRHWHDACWKVA